MTPSFYDRIVPETNAGFYTDVGYEPEGLAQQAPRLSPGGNDHDPVSAQRAASAST